MPSPGPLRRALPALLAGLLPLAGPRAARAAAGAEAVVVLDRGLAARDRADPDAVLAARVARALGHGVPLLLQAARADGTPRTGEAQGEGAEALAADAKARTKGAFEGPTDARLALATAARRLGAGPSPVVVLLGPFAGSGGEDAARALEAWNAKAPEGVRVFAVGLSPEALEAVAGARGLVERGSLLLSLGPAEAETAPWSPFAVDERGRPAPFEAVVRVPVEALPAGRGPPDAPALVASSSLERDLVEPVDASRPEGAPAAAFRVRRDRADGRVATLTFRVASRPDVLALAEPPAPRTFTWDALAPDARLQGADGGPPGPFRVSEAVFGKVYEGRYRLRRSRTEPTPRWRVEGGAEVQPQGLSVLVAPEVSTSEEVAEAEVTVRFAPRRDATPPLLQGRILVASADLGLAFPVDYALRTAPGGIRWLLEAPAEPTPVPRAAGDAAWAATAEPAGANAPDPATAVLAVEPPEAAARLRLRRRGPDGEEVLLAPGVPAPWRTGVRYEVAPVLLPGDPGAGLDGATLRLAPVPERAADAEASPPAAVRSRRPRLRIVAGPPRYRVEDGRPASPEPLRLRVDPDGGDAEYVALLASTAPRVHVPADAPLAWALEEEVPGAWRVVPRGPWRGPRPAPFSERAFAVPLRLSWDAGEAPEVPPAAVTQAARWGAAGYLLIGLAAAAVVLALFVARQMRAPPFVGTLLYAAEGLEGAVGRLDLADLGRRGAALRSDAQGRLSLGGTEGEAVGALLPTRLGGVIDVLGEDGGRERRLLVDGLTLRFGRHRVRYVSGSADAQAPWATEEVPDLLGPEYDLASGRTVPPGDAAAGEAGGDGGRS